MLPELRQDRSALRWIRGELDQSLRDARNSLEDFAEGEQGRLNECADLLHHVHGALEMVQIYGGAMLADEMERLARAMSHDQVKRPDAASEALMLGLVQLPAYLEKVEAGGADVPLVLLPLMNDLRAAREAPLVSETSLFAPKLNTLIAAETVRPGSGNRDMPRLIHHYRTQYHRGLLNWIRNQHVSASLGLIRDVLDVLNSAAGTARFRRLLDAAEALTIALNEDEEAPALAVKPLFGKLDQVFKRVIDQGEEAAMLDFPVDLLKNLLYYIARSNSRDPAVVAVKQAADLVNTFTDQTGNGTAVAALGAPDRELFGAVGEALAQDLRDVKDQLDLYIRGDRTQLDRLTGLAQPIQRIGDTLGMVGRGDLRTRLKRFSGELDAARESGEAPADDSLMSLASELLFVESSLANLDSGEAANGVDGEAADGTPSQMLSEGEMRLHQRAAIDEALVEIAKAKDEILEYLEQPEQPQRLAEVPDRLRNVAGVMAMLEIPEAGRLLGELRPYMDRLAAGEQPAPDVVQRDALADVIMSAELYMHSAVEPGADREKLLVYAEQALQRLGLREQPVAEPDEVSGAGGEPDVPVAAEASDGDALSAVEPEPRRMEVEAGSEAEAAEPEVESEPEREVEDAGAVDTEEDEIDSEILEIFAEEAQEELESIQRCLPAWRNNLEDKESLQTMRRSFHTLKGSGRIVGASNIGEFAWSVENLLNRVIDGTVDAGPDVLALMDEVGEVLPTLVDEAGQPGATDTDVSHLYDRAFALASGSKAPAPAEVAAEPVGEAPAEQPAETVAEAVVDQSAETAAESAREPSEGMAAEVPAEAVEEPEEPGKSVQELEAPAEEIAVANEVAVEDAADVSAGPAEEERLALPDEFAIPVIDSDAQAEPKFADAQEPLSLDGLEEPGDDSLMIEVVGERRSGAAGGPTGDESILTATEVQDSEFTDLDAAASQSADSSLSAVFLSEVKSHLNVLDEFVQRCVATPGGCVMEVGVRRAMHTLRGSARIAGAESMADLAESLEVFSEALQYQQRKTDGRTLDLLNRSHNMLARLAAAFDDEQQDVPGWRELLDEVHAETAALSEPDTAESSTAQGVEQSAFDPELLEIFLDEAKELLEALEGELQNWEQGGEDDQPVARLQRNLHTMKGGSRLAGVNSVGDLSHALESVFESVVERRIEGDGRLKGLVRHATDALAQDIENLLAGEVPVEHSAMVERLEAAAHGRPWDEVAPDEISFESESMLVESTVDSPSALAEEAGPQAESVAESGPQAEADEQTETAIEPAAQVEPEPLLPVGAGGAVEAAHAIAEAEPELGPEPAMAAELAEELGDFDADSTLLTDSQLMTDSELLGDSSLLIEPVAEQQHGDAAAGPDAPTVVQFPSGEVLPEHADGFVPRKPLPEEPAAPHTASERVRVAAESLDQMVNNAGEVSIYRARIEQQNGSIAFNLGELQQTIDRLRGQLRGLELETEAQILSRHERDTEIRADFDPLEMDRYSTMQQLSRALSETVEDLSNLGQSLNDLSRDTDTLLLQQARVTTDLQDGLLRTRMVRFASRVPRLERVVRQTSHSVGKHADLEVVGGDEDMDRAILERMMGPLEHLLRNAVSHGIEDAETRKAHDKPAHGLITLQLAREGTDVVLTLSDDGGGLDRERIREKAVQRGLLEDGAVIEDDDLYQLIMQPGFSTAQELSQVSGRGVGMDVVLTEVKQLGGTIDIDSQPGHGTSFTIRLPFTLAITDALLVTVGEDYYAVPHSSMDGVVRIDVDELRAIYAGQQDTFSSGGRDYTVRYLGSMLGAAAPNIPDASRWVPLLLVRSGENRVAIQVDGLLGNRQIVVKSIGAQLSGVRWFSGGTILADGQIALILDTNALVRMDSAQQSVVEESAAEPVSKGVSVMVVDDSITVRKVTSRLLERHNMHVVTAKDGVDAVTQLQETRPDVMLLDIEMPRMDGFELARHMRTTEELSDIPIIMITSRTGDKHRDRAKELGVKRYLGKPYQEADLLENIYTVLAESAL